MPKDARKNASPDNDGLSIVRRASFEFCNPLLSPTFFNPKGHRHVDCMIFISSLSSPETKNMCSLEPIYLIRFRRGRGEEKESAVSLSLSLCLATYDASHSSPVSLPACQSLLSVFPLAQFCIPINCRVAHSGATASTIRCGRSCMLFTQSTMMH